MANSNLLKDLSDNSTILMFWTESKTKREEVIKIKRKVSMIAILEEICIWIIKNSNAFAIKVFKMPSKKAAEIMFGRREKQ